MAVILITLIFPNDLENWKRFDGVGKQFLFVSDQMENSEAKLFCASLNARLFEPRDQDITKLVINQAKTEGIELFWLGIHNKAFEETDFVHNSDNQPIEWNNWSDANGDQCSISESGCNDCAIVDLDDNGEWYDYPCSGYTDAVVCERDTQGNCCKPKYVK